MNWAAAAAAATLSIAAPCQTDPQGALNKPQLLLKSVETRTSGFSIEAWSDSADGTYLVGEAVGLFVRGSADAYYTVLAIGPRGDVLRLYPNDGEVPGLVRAGQVLALPQTGTGQTIRAVHPSGVELLKIVGTQSPLILPEVFGEGSVPADVAAASLQAELLRLTEEAVSVTDIELRTIAERACEAR
jgi:hypothetical protein